MRNAMDERNNSERASSRVTLDEARHSRPAQDFDPDASREVVETLNHILANEFTLFTKTLNYHWNVTGPRFYFLHEFFESQYKELLSIMDETAERVRVLGESPVSTLREMRSDNTIIETPGKFMSADKMINDLLAGHMEIQRQITHALELKGIDKGTEDLLINLLRAHEKASWMLKSHLM